MTDDRKSMQDRLNALRGETRSTLSNAGQAAREAIERIESERAIEAQQRESHRVAAIVAAKDKSEGIFTKTARVIKGTEESNPNNLYGLGTLCKAFGDAVAGPLKSISNATGITWAAHKADDVWRSSPLYPLRWATESSSGALELASTGVKKWVSLNYALYNAARISYDDDGTKHIRPGRAIMAIMASALATTTLAGAIYETPIVAYEAAVYSATARTENFILHGASAVANQHDSYLTGGCLASEKVCDEDNTVAFRIQPSSFLVLKNLVRGHYWRPEMVATAIPKESANCQVTHAGGRFKILSRAFDMYPYIVDVKCDGVVPHVAHAAPAPPMAQLAMN